jgi:hypothetical protein
MKHTFDEQSWSFPFDRLEVESAVLCLRRDESTSEIYSEGGRIEFRPIELPDINLGYQRSAPVALHVMFELPRFPFDGLAALAGKRITPSEEWHAENYGSVYAFSAHNPVDTLEAVFGQPTQNTIPLHLALRFDFDFEGRIGGVSQHRFLLTLSLERRWEP